MDATETAAPTEENPGKTEVAPPRPISKPSTRESVLESLFPVGKNCGKNKTTPFKNRNRAIKIILSAISDLLTKHYRI
jgi:hypothetical protein